MEILKKKISYAVGQVLNDYLLKYGRHVESVPEIYRDLSRFSGTAPYQSPAGAETLWHSVMFPPGEMAELRPKLTRIYASLKMGGGAEVAQHLDVERIDFGEFGNSRPFRIRIINRYNDNFDHYYVKSADASRIYGLELEHILSPTRINYMVNGNTLIEEHIAGLPGDVFLRDWLHRDEINEVRIAKEFVKFNERCFIRLLGDMRAVNYVVDITPDFEEVQYRVRPIDFDQQSHEGRKKMYMAQFFSDNQPMVEMIDNLLNEATIDQYRKEERTLVARRCTVAGLRLGGLLDAMSRDELSPTENIDQLGNELAEHHQSRAFKTCTTMGGIVRAHIGLLLDGLY